MNAPGMKVSALALGSLFLFRVCGRGEPSPANAPAIAVSTPTSTSSAPMLPAPPPAHGGAVTAGAALAAELVSEASGRVLAFVVTPRGETLPDAEVMLGHPAGKPEAPVTMAYDDELGGFVGYPVGVPAGQYPADVQVFTPGNTDPAVIHAPPLEVRPVELPSATHGGRVEAVAGLAVNGFTKRLRRCAAVLDGHERQARFSGRCRASRRSGWRPRGPTNSPTVVEGDHYRVVGVGRSRNTFALGMPRLLVRGRPVRRVVVARPVARHVPVLVAAPIAPGVVVEGPGIGVPIGVGVRVRGPRVVGVPHPGVVVHPRRTRAFPRAGYRCAWTWRVRSRAFSLEPTLRHGHTAIDELVPAFLARLPSWESTDGLGV